MKTNPNPPSWDKGVEEILKPFHRHNCRFRQAWFKGQTEDFPCDCDIAETKAALTALVEEVIIGEDVQVMLVYPYTVKGTEPEVIRNELRQEQRSKLRGGQ